MARVFLNNETFNAASDDAEINGSAGTEQVNVFAGVTGLEVTSSVERVDLPGDIADFTFSSFGNSVTILDGNGDIVAQISGGDGKQLVFGDGSIDVAFDGTTLTAGGETVGSNAGPITPAASEIDATTTSGTANGGAETFTLTASSPTVIEGDSGTTDMTFIVELDSAPSEDTVVNYQTTSGDVVTDAGAITFVAGQTTASVTVQANSDDLVDGDDTIEVTFSGDALDASVVASGTVTDDDSAFVFSSTTTPTVAENTTDVVTLAGSDADGSASTFAITGGADESAFSISGSTLSLNTAPDFEASADADADGVYNVTVTATDEGGNTTDQNLSVTVTDVNEASVITSGGTANVDENAAAATVVYTAAVTDEDAGDTVAYSLTGTDAAALSINSAGEVTLNASADFETKPSYSFNVVATDAAGAVATQAVTLSVNDVNEAPEITSTNAFSVAEGATAVDTVAATDPENDTVTFTLTGAGADDSLFNIDGATGALSLKVAEDFENPTNTGNSYSVQVQADDGNGGTTTQDITVSVTDVEEAQTFSLTASSPSITEGDTGTKNLTFTLTLDESPTEATTVNYQTLTTGTATSGDDFDVVAGAVEFAAGQTVATVSVTVNNDTDFEADETVQIQFSGDSLTSSVTATGTITNDDVDPDTVSQTIALTTNVDTGADFVGAGADDTFRAVVGTDGTTANGTTLQAGDDLDGGAGSDELAISITGTHGGAVTRDTFTLSGIERVSVSNSEQSANDDTISLSLATGVETVALSSSSADGDTVFSNVQNIVNAEMSNGAGDLTVNYAAAAVAGTADEMTLTVSGVTAGAFTVDDGIETFSVVSSGTADNTLTTLDSGDVETVTISGSADLTITDDVDADVTTVDASAATGDIDIEEGSAVAMTLTGGAGNDTLEFNNSATDDVVSGGAGNDRIIFAGGRFDNADTVDGGDGTDTLVAQSADLTGYTTADPATLSNIEGLEVSDALGANLTTADVLAGIDTVTLAAALGAARTITFEAGAKTVNLQAASTDDLTVVDTGTAVNDTLSVVNDQDGAVDIFGGNSLVVTGFETVTIDGSADGATEQDVDVITITPDTDGTATLNLIGSDNFDVDGIITADVIDASGLTGDAILDMAVAATGVETITGSANDDILVGDASSTINGGAGADNITGGTGDDTLIGGAGADEITANTGDDSIDGGAGDDTFTLAGNLTSADTIDGGEGDDTLNVTNLSGDALTNVSNVETVAVTGASTVSLSSDLVGAESLDLSDGAVQSLTFADGYTAAITVALGDDAGDTVVNGANIALTVTANSDNLAGADDTILTGSADAVDTLNVTNAGGTIDMATDITDFDVVNVLDNPDTDDLDLTIDVANHGVADGSLTVDASALDDGEVLTIENEADADLTVTGGAGADSVELGAGSDTIRTGAGNDTVLDAAGGGGLDATDTLDGGDGDDILQISGALTDIQLLNVSNFETLVATTDDTLTLAGQFSSSGITTVRGDMGGDNTDINAASATADIDFVVTDDNDVIVGGNGNDDFIVGQLEGASLIDADDSFDGNGGTNRIILVNDDDDADTNGDAVTATLDGGYTDFGSILVQDDATDNAAGDVTVTLQTAFAEETVTIDGTALDAGEVLTVDASANTDEELVTVTGGAGADVVTGGAGADTIDGGTGADEIDGNGGADNLTGGAGADTFEYAATSTTTDSTSTSTDTITDFAAGSDNIAVAVDRSGAGADVTADFTDKGDASSISDGLALLSSTDGEVFFNTGSNQLVMDLDGNGLIQSTDLVINMTGETGFSDADLNITYTGSGNVDTVTTGAGNDTIDTAVGADDITTGGGEDVVRLDDGDSVVATAETLTEAGIQTNETITFGNGVDVINDFTTGSDTLDVATANDLTVFADGDDVQAGAIDANENFVIHGSFDSNNSVFTVDDDGADAVVLFDADGTDTFAGDDNLVILVGVGAGEIAAADFV